MSLAAAAAAFAAVLPAEIPDKTMIATVVLVSRFRRPLLVWCGVASAFALHVLVAVTAGGLLTLLPETLVKVATAVLFGVGAVVLWRHADHTDDEDPDRRSDGAPASNWSVLAGSFGVVLVAEWGDLTQLATAGVAASTGAPVAAGIGAVAALWTAAALAVVAGRSLEARVPVHLLQRFAAGVFAALSVVTLLALAR